MSNLISFRIEGGKELAKNLKRLPIQLEKVAVKEALNEGAKIVRKDARDRVPQDRGVLKRAIQIVRRRDPSLISIAVRSGRKFASRRMNAWYAHFVEFGTRDYPAQPFLRPALDGNRERVVKAMSGALSEALRRFAAGYRTRRQARRAGFR